MLIDDREAAPAARMNRETLTGLPRAENLIRASTSQRSDFSLGRTGKPGARALHRNSPGLDREHGHDQVSSLASRIISPGTCASTPSPGR